MGGTSVGRRTDSLLHLPKAIECSKDVSNDHATDVVVGGLSSTVGTGPPQPGVTPTPYCVAGGAVMGGTAREQILAAIDRISPGSGDTFTISDVLQELRSQGSDLAESTIRTHITSRMCGDSPDHHGTTYDDLERVDRGVYRLRRAR